MNEPVKIIGSYLSPYVRKVLAVLHLKEVAYEIDPIVAFMGDDRFSALSPVRRIPVLIDDRVTLCDSSVICQYLEDCYPATGAVPGRPLRSRPRPRALAQECFKRLNPFEDKMLRTPIAKHRDALAAMGAPLMSETYGTATPRRGLMRI